MGIIKARKLVHEYIRRDDEGNVESIETALDKVDLDVQAGEFIAILGHNGSGKSTLAKHINAILEPSEGSLWVDGFDVSDDANIWEVRQRAGMVFQNPDNQLVAWFFLWILLNPTVRDLLRSFRNSYLPD